MTKLTIGKVAEACGVKIDTLRYYENIGLVEAEGRTASGYRLYHPDSIRRVKFIKNAQGLGFSLEEIRSLLDLQTSDTASAEDVLKVTENKILEFNHKISELDRMRDILKSLAGECPGNVALQECPILDHLYPKIDTE